MKAITELSGGDMRRALNIMQSTSMAFSIINEDNVYTCTGHPLRSDIKNVVQWMLADDLNTAHDKISNLKQLKGLALHDIITEVHLLVHRIDFPSKVKVGIVEKLAEIEYRLSFGSSEKLQTTAMIACFNSAKDPVIEMAVSS